MENKNKTNLEQKNRKNARNVLFYISERQKHLQTILTSDEWFKVEQNVTSAKAIFRKQDTF